MNYFWAPVHVLLITTLASSILSVRNEEVRSSLPSSSNSELERVAVHSRGTLTDTSDFRTSTKVLSLSSENFDISIVPKVISVDSTSARIFWTLRTTKKDDQHSQDINISLRVNFRPFGSVTTREVLLTIHESTLGDDVRENSYTINNLVPDTGYVFCFSLLVQGEESEEYHDYLQDDNVNHTNSLKEEPKENSETGETNLNLPHILSESFPRFSFPLLNEGESEGESEKESERNPNQESITPEGGADRDGVNEDPEDDLNFIRSEDYPVDKETKKDHEVKLDLEQKETEKERETLSETGENIKEESTPTKVEDDELGIKLGEIEKLSPSQDTEIKKVQEITPERRRPSPPRQPPPQVPFQGGPFVNLPSPRSRSQLPLPQGNYAYTSTGELIYLSSSSWRPSRRKRSDESASRSLVEGVETKRFCIEIITEISLPISVFSPIMIMIYLIMLVIIVIFALVLAYFVRKCYRRYNKRKMLTKGPKETKITCRSTTPPLDTCDLSFQTPKMTPEITSKRTHFYDKPPEKLDEPRFDSLSHKNSQESQKDYVFHPGYEIPPSSTMEVYGYDFPRANRSIPATPSTLSCELNTSDYPWNFPKYNLNIPFNDNQIDEYKESKPKKFFPQILLPKKLQLNESESMCQCSKKSCSCSNKEAKLGSHGLNLSQNLNSKEKITKREKLSNIRLGERVTISGGTLLEVPEGYVIPRPNPSERIRIIVKGPVEL